MPLNVLAVTTIDLGTLIPIGAVVAIFGGVVAVVWRASKKDSSFDAVVKDQASFKEELAAMKVELAELRSKLDKMHGEQQAAALGRHEKLESRIASLVKQLERLNKK